MGSSMQPEQLTKQMSDVLKDCLKRESEGNEPCDVMSIGLQNELLVRGLITVRGYTFKSGERKAAYFITDLGKEYLKQQHIK